MLLKVPFGLIDRELVEPIQALEHQGKTAVCPECKGELSVKAATSVAKTIHFAHKAKSSCEHGWETAIHLMGKDIISEYQKMTIPSASGSVEQYQSFNGITAHVSFSTDPIDVHFLMAEIECRVESNHIIDVMMRGNHADIAVEVKVTHEVDEAKSQGLKALGYYVVEVDLNGLRKFADINRGLIENYLTDNWPDITTWLSLPNFDIAESIAKKQLNHKIQHAREKWEARQGQCSTSNKGFNSTSQRLYQTSGTLNDQNTHSQEHLNGQSFESFKTLLEDPEYVQTVQEKATDDQLANSQKINKFMSQNIPDIRPFLQIPRLYSCDLGPCVQFILQTLKRDDEISASKLESEIRNKYGFRRTLDPRIDSKKIRGIAQETTLVIIELCDHLSEKGFIAKFDDPQGPLYKLNNY